MRISPISFKSNSFVNFNYSSTPTYNSVSNNTKTNLPQFNKDLKYNEEKANNLANDVKNNAESQSTGYCAKYVSDAISRTGLGIISGHAYQCADSLRSDSNFKEIKVAGEDLKALPAGFVIVYDRGAAGYSADYGHVEVTLGDGRAASDFVNNDIKASDKVSVFVPV